MPAFSIAYNTKIYYILLMNPRYDHITVAEMLRYIAAHEKAANLNKDLTILRETAVDPISKSQFFIGKFRCFFEDIGNEHVAVTCPGLRVFHEVLSMKLIDKMASRYERRVVQGHAFAENTNLGYLFTNGYQGIVGYWYYDERTGKRRVYLYHKESETSYILKFEGMIKFIVGEDGLEHCVNNEYKVVDTIEKLAHPDEPESPPRKSVIQDICDLFRKPKADSKEQEKEVVKKLSDWIASQKPLDPADAKLLEEHLWELV